MTHEIGTAPPDFAEFYRAEAVRVQHVMSAFCGRELGAEAAAEGFARMLERWARLRDVGPLQRRAYVLTTAKNYARRRAESESRYVPLEDRPGQEPAALDAALDRVDDRLGLEREVRRLIDAQPHRRRQVAFLYFLHDDGYGEIAQLLEMNESTVRSHVAELRKLLRPYVRRLQEITEASEHGRA
ncbi:sigma-70 family RNA polymerase sigma factor [Dactylosporangium salmoneum]|uniref:RNA polymerase sigma factor 70 region 4 type 2 domain-containing protein n=1 Tax=Dactylosporangium salmoneum TaxID=53361 RepID=A0ABP5UTR4_9ACTN